VDGDTLSSASTLTSSSSISLRKVSSSTPFPSNQQVSARATITGFNNFLTTVRLGGIVEDVNILVVNPLLDTKGMAGTSIDIIFILFLTILVLSVSVFNYCNFFS